ncbi:MAG: hypothetical protein KA954_12180 [Chitinophagales bacterium]|nr:hypothetical protein [Chitinophagales bacterium]MBP9188743.1 hypothetical protein [Chitinophagales bacterium]
MENDNINELLNSYKSLLEKSGEANKAIIEEAGEIFKKILNNKIELSQISNFNNEVMSNAVSNLMRLNIAYTENLLNLSVITSKSINNFFDQDNSNSNSEENNDVNNAEEKIQYTKNVINLSAQQGETLSTKFTIDNAENRVQTGRFLFNNFISETGKSAENIQLKIKPAKFDLPAGHSTDIDMIITVPEKMMAGNYMNSVIIEGIENSEFDIELEVIKKTVKKTPAKKSKPTTAAKKSVSAKKSKK